MSNAAVKKGTAEDSKVGGGPSQVVLWPCAPLGKVCEINPRRRPGVDRADDAPTSFVPMAAVDDRSGTICNLLERPFGEVRKGFTYFEDGDVIFAKITPCMQNGKHAICERLRGGFGFGSTEFHVLRPGPAVAAKWVHYFVRRPDILDRAVHAFIGSAGQQRLPESFLQDLEIPLPPLAEQERIAARLTAQLAIVERARAAAAKRLAAAEALPAAYLREVFEGPEWPVIEMADGMFGFEAGTSVVAMGRPAQDHEWGVIKVSAVSWGEFRSHENKAVPPGYVPREHERIKPGDFLISRANTAELAGAVALVRDTPKNLMLSDKTLRLLINRNVFLPEYLEYALRTRSVRKFIEGNATGTSASMRNISQPTIRAIPVPRPSLADQRRIAVDLNHRHSDAARLVERLRAELAAIDALPAAFLREAFEGNHDTGNL